MKSIGIWSKYNVQQSVMMATGMNYFPSRDSKPSHVKLYNALHFAEKICFVLQRKVFEKFK